MVRSIAKIPDQRVFLMSSNRFEIIKVELKTSQVSVFTNPIDEIRFLVAPHQVYKLKEEVFPLFVATSLNSNMNMMMDYTTMKPVRFFSISLIPSKLKRYQTQNSLLLSKKEKFGKFTLF